MRLICPNCEAQYEVSDDAIPPGGRDVQCSNCQLSWFQTEKPTVPGRTPLKLSNEQEHEIDAPTSIAEAAPEPETTAETPEESAQSFVEEVASEFPPTAPEQEPAPALKTSTAPPEPMRRQLDNAVANILREEAALGTAAVAAAAKPPSPVAKPPATETPKPATPVAADETRQRIAMMTAEEGGIRSGTKTGAAKGDTANADEAHLRTVPSINEINATLRARAQANDASGLTEAEKIEAVERKGFRRGFFWVLLLMILAILPYVFADQITENLPQTTEFMASYVMTIDQLRLSLSEMVEGFMAE
ncbi:zinc-ribbon domain-containing protein [Yoonia sp.]|uniref:zinc-ribbon domain-containing protein n=1 Tax=Yoonia sp. TaxID=2212373 RepID=UPI002DFCF25B|nr:zinc-ribbon domain-containing protein [Yoonia sp.]